MTDWADGSEMRNNGIKCVIDARIVSEFLRTIVSLGMIGGALLFFSWVRGQIVDTGYESQRLFETEEALLGIEEKLVLEEETLTNPERIERLATLELGMARLRPGQLILPQPETGDRGMPASLALAGAKNGGLKKSGEGRRFVNYLTN